MNSKDTLRKQVEAQREILESLVRVVTTQAKQIDGLLAASEEMLRSYEMAGNLTDSIDMTIASQLTSLASRLSALEAVSNLDSSKE